MYKFSKDKAELNILSAGQRNNPESKSTNGFIDDVEESMASKDDEPISEKDIAQTILENQHVAESGSHNSDEIIKEEVNQFYSSFLFKP